MPDLLAMPGAKLGGDPLRIGIAGFGNVGQDVARRLLGGAIEGIGLVAVTASDLARADTRAQALSPKLRAVSLAELAAACDVVLECATGAALPQIARAVLGEGKQLICVSAGGLLDAPDILDLAIAKRGRIHIATGALPGLDMLRCAAEGNVASVHLFSRIRPESMAKEPYLLGRGLNFEAAKPTGPVQIFNGTAREAARHFPRHLNIAVALSIAGIGLDRTTLELWVDPAVAGAINTLTIEADDISLTLTSRNIPSANRKTSRIVAPSMIAALRRLVSPVVAGS